MMLIIASAALRLSLTALITYKLIWWGHMLNQIERCGLGLMGGSGFLTVAVIADAHKEGTPFDVWAGLLFTAGVGIYLIGRLSRHIRHEKRNAEMAAQGKAYRAGKGTQ
jgi:hypothetical protein